MDQWYSCIEEWPVAQHPVKSSIGTGVVSENSFHDLYTNFSPTVVVWESDREEAMVYVQCSFLQHIKIQKHEKLHVIETIKN